MGLTRTGFRLAAVLAMLASPAWGAPTRSSPIAVVPGAGGDVVFVVNPDSNTVARLDWNAMHVGTRTAESPATAPLVYPRTLAAVGDLVVTAGQSSDTAVALRQADLSVAAILPLGTGCNPYGVAPTPDGRAVLITCQGSSELLVLGAGAGGLTVEARIELPYSNARAIAVSDRSADRGRAYVTHYLTEEPGTDGHVSVVDLAQKSVARVILLPADRATCETQNSGQGVLNLVSAIALVPDGAPPEVANQVWLGGTQENVLAKGIFKRFGGGTLPDGTKVASFADRPGAALFPLATFTPFPEKGGGAITRNRYKASFHDITRFGIWKMDALTGNQVGKLDVDEANNATDIEFSPDGTVAYVVDLMFNSYHVFNTRKGQGSDVTTLFAAPGRVGPGGADPSGACVADALSAVTAETGFRMVPQAEIRPIDGYDPVDPSGQPVNTGVEFDANHFMATGQSRMIPGGVPDAVGTAPIGVRLSPDGTVAYVANYLARNVLPVATAARRTPEGKVEDFRCISTVETGENLRCATDTDCPATVGVCNHPGGATCNPQRKDADCAAQGKEGPCLAFGADCVPLVLGQPVTSTGADPLPAAILDGKILFNTAARDGSTKNAIGLTFAAPLFNDPDGYPARVGSVIPARTPGAIVSVSHDASYVTCSTCHADFGGQDGRTWDFAQFGASLRNSMDLRGRAGFAPGKCKGQPQKECFFDAACGDGDVCVACVGAGECETSRLVPRTVKGADRERYFNPMLTVHWNGDRDEVEDFEHTFRSLMGGGDCDGNEENAGCQGALVQRSAATAGDCPSDADCADVNPDLGAPNRNFTRHGKNVGIRLTHMADFVYSLTAFPRNPNQPTPAAERGRALFNDTKTGCLTCHAGGPGGKQFFTDKEAVQNLASPNEIGGADRNNPFVRHDVGTANLFDQADPFVIAAVSGNFQSCPPPPGQCTTPGSRGTLGDYVTPVLNDLWNTPPYLHDGSAHTLLDVVRPCRRALDDCLAAGRGRNVNGQHGVTEILTPQQLNDLVDFQLALTTETVLASGGSTLRPGTLQLRTAVLQFPKRPKKKGKRPRGTSSFVVAGRMGGEAADARRGVVFSIATPVGGRMAILSETFTMKGRGATLRGKRRIGKGVVVLVLRRSGDGYRFAAAGTRLDLSALDGGNTDLTVSFEIGGAQFVQNRYLTGKKNVFKLPRKKRKA